MRKSLISSNAIVYFIAPDDEAIGAEGEDAYLEYLKSGDTRHLKLIDGITPVRYLLKPMTTKAYQSLNDLMKFAVGRSPDPDGDLADIELDVEPELYELNLSLEYEKLLRSCLVGYQNHTEIDQLNEFGEFEYTKYDCKPGEKLDEAVLESLKQDHQFMMTLWQFLLHISTLTETEKNR